MLHVFISVGLVFILILLCAEVYIKQIAIIPYLLALFQVALAFPIQLQPRCDYLARW